MSERRKNLFVAARAALFVLGYNEVGKIFLGRFLCHRLSLWLGVALAACSKQRYGNNSDEDMVQGQFVILL